MGIKKVFASFVYSDNFAWLSFNCITAAAIWTSAYSSDKHIYQFYTTE